MTHSKISGIGFYVPEKIVTNHDLAKLMDTTNEWIIERTGIQERRYARKHEETTTTMAARAAEIAIKRAGIEKTDLDFIVFATLSPDYYFPGCGVLLQRELGINHTEIPAIDIRNQCSGFIYALSVADQFIKTGMYRNVLVVGAEFHSCGLDFTTRGRNVTAIFGDGAGAVVVQPAQESDESGILATCLHSDGKSAEELAYLNPGCHGGYYVGKEQFNYTDDEFGGIFLNQSMIENAQTYPQMNGQFVFKMAVQKFPAVILEILQKTGYSVSDIDMLVPHQANLRISQFVQQKLQLPDHKVWNNIQRYGNTTAASIPIALCEAYEAGAVKKGDLVCLAAFGSGFTWGSALIRW
ncbi:MAG: ketoacyl-ACP synthase III [Chitinophagales bacterium]|jgi:3-oxoacyl-[acyl-carrier-protein] synthase-3|nr:ketoacyl-ACP synthase III [Chitinophagales bacterium]